MKEFTPKPPDADADVELEKSASASLILRKYQEAVLSATFKSNTLAVLPTGSGKTLIASHFLSEYKQRHISKLRKSFELLRRSKELSATIEMTNQTEENFNPFLSLDNDDSKKEDNEDLLRTESYLSCIPSSSSLIDLPYFDTNLCALNHFLSLTVSLFIAPTKMLAIQQYNYLKSNTHGLRVGLLTGEHDEIFPSFSFNKFKKEDSMRTGHRLLFSLLDNLDIIVVTPILALEIIQSSLIPRYFLLSVVVDECHHVFGQNPIVRLIKIISESMEIGPSRRDPVDEVKRDFFLLSRLFEDFLGYFQYKTETPPVFSVGIEDTPTPSTAPGIYFKDESFLKNFLVLMPCFHLRIFSITASPVPHYSISSDLSEHESFFSIISHLEANLNCKLLQSPEIIEAFTLFNSTSKNLMFRYEKSRTIEAQALVSHNNTESSLLNLGSLSKTTLEKTTHRIPDGLESEFSKADPDAKAYTSSSRIIEKEILLPRFDDPLFISLYNHLHIYHCCDLRAMIGVVCSDYYARLQTRYPPQGSMVIDLKCSTDFFLFHAYSTVKFSHYFNTVYQFISSHKLLIEDLPTLASSKSNLKFPSLSSFVRIKKNMKTQELFSAKKKFLNYDGIFKEKFKSPIIRPEPGTLYYDYRPSQNAEDYGRSKDILCADSKPKKVMEVKLPPSGIFSPIFSASSKTTLHDSYLMFGQLLTLLEDCGVITCLYTFLCCLQGKKKKTQGVLRQDQEELKESSLSFLQNSEGIYSTATLANYLSNLDDSSLNIYEEEIASLGSSQTTPVTRGMPASAQDSTTSSKQTLDIDQVNTMVNELVAVYAYDYILYPNCHQIKVGGGAVGQASFPYTHNNYDLISLIDEETISVVALLDFFFGLISKLSSLLITRSLESFLSSANLAPHIKFSEGNSLNMRKGDFFLIINPLNPLLGDSQENPCSFLDGCDFEAEFGRYSDLLLAHKDPNTLQTALFQEMPLFHQFLVMKFHYPSLNLMVLSHEGLLIFFLMMSLIKSDLLSHEENEWFLHLTPQGCTPLIFTGLKKYRALISRSIKFLPKLPQKSLSIAELFFSSSSSFSLESHLCELYDNLSNLRVSDQKIKLYIFMFLRTSLQSIAEDDLHDWNSQNLDYKVQSISKKSQITKDTPNTTVSANSDPYILNPEESSFTVGQTIPRRKGWVYSYSQFPLISDKIFALKNLWLYMLELLETDSYFLSSEPKMEISTKSNDYTFIIFCKLKLCATSLNFILNLLLLSLKRENYVSSSPSQRLKLSGQPQLSASDSSSEVTDARRGSSLTINSYSLVGGTNVSMQSKLLDSFNNSVPIEPENQNQNHNKINLLACTDVAEEGIDIKICKGVINFDPPSTLKSIIQRKGRARDSNGYFFTLSPSDLSGDKTLQDMIQLLNSQQSVENIVTNKTKLDRQVASIPVLNVPYNLQKESQFSPFINEKMPLSTIFGFSCASSHLTKENFFDISYNVSTTGASIDVRSSVQYLSKIYKSFISGSFSSQEVANMNPIYWVEKLNKAALMKELNFSLDLNDVFCDVNADFYTASLFLPGQFHPSIKYIIGNGKEYLHLLSTNDNMGNDPLALFFSYDNMDIDGEEPRSLSPYTLGLGAPNKNLAKGLVALECIRRLHLAGELNDNLLMNYGTTTDGEIISQDMIRRYNDNNLLSSALLSKNDDIPKKVSLKNKFLTNNDLETDVSLSISSCIKSSEFNLSAKDLAYFYSFFASILIKQTPNIHTYYFSRMTDSETNTDVVNDEFKGTDSVKLATNLVPYCLRPQLKLLDSRLEDQSLYPEKLFFYLFTSLRNPVTSLPIPVDCPSCEMYFTFTNNILVAFPTKLPDEVLQSLSEQSDTNMRINSGLPTNNLFFDNIMRNIDHLVTSVHFVGERPINQKELISLQLYSKSVLALQSDYFMSSVCKREFEKRYPDFVALAKERAQRETCSTLKRKIYEETPGVLSGERDIYRNFSGFIQDYEDYFSALQTDNWHNFNTTLEPGLSIFSTATEYSALFPKSPQDMIEWSQSSNGLCYFLAPCPDPPVSLTRLPTHKQDCPTASMLKQFPVMGSYFDQKHHEHQAFCYPCLSSHSAKCSCSFYSPISSCNCTDLKQITRDWVKSIEVWLSGSANHTFDKNWPEYVAQQTDVALVTTNNMIFQKRLNLYFNEKLKNLEKSIEDDKKKDENDEVEENNEIVPDTKKLSTPLELYTSQHHNYIYYKALDSIYRPVLNRSKDLSSSSYSNFSLFTRGPGKLFFDLPLNISSSRLIASNDLSDLHDDYSIDETYRDSSAAKCEFSLPVILSAFRSISPLQATALIHEEVASCMHDLLDYIELCHADDEEPDLKIFKSNDTSLFPPSKGSIASNSFSLGGKPVIDCTEISLISRHSLLSYSASYTQWLKSNNFSMLPQQADTIPWNPLPLRETESSRDNDLESDIFDQILSEVLSESAQDCVSSIFESKEIQQNYLDIFLNRFPYKTNEILICMEGDLASPSNPRNVNCLQSSPFTPLVPGISINSKLTIQKMINDNCTFVFNRSLRNNTNKFSKSIQQRFDQFLPPGDHTTLGPPTYDTLCDTKYQDFILQNLVNEEAESGKVYHDHYELLYFISDYSLYLGDSRIIYHNVLVPSFIWRLVSLMNAHEFKMILGEIVTPIDCFSVPSKLGFHDISFSEYTKGYSRYCGNERNITYQYNSIEDTKKFQTTLTVAEIKRIAEHSLGDEEKKPLIAQPKLLPSLQDILETTTYRLTGELFNNERLEFLGDSVLKLYASITLFERYPLKQEGFLTVNRSLMVSNYNLLKTLLSNNDQAIRGKLLKMITYLRLFSLNLGKQSLSFYPPGYSPDLYLNNRSLWSLNLNTPNRLLVSFNRVCKLDSQEFSSLSQDNDFEINNGILNFSASDLKEFSELALSNTLHVKTKKFMNGHPPSSPIDMLDDLLFSPLAYHSIAQIKSKNVADVLEALIGLFFRLGGGVLAENFIDSIGIMNICPPETLPVKMETVKPENTVTVVDKQPIRLEEVSFPLGYPLQLQRLSNSDGTEEPHLETESSPQASLTYTLFTTREDSAVDIFFDYLSKQYGYHFQDRSFLKESMTHGSVITSKTNQRLEFLGDSVLDLVVISELYNDFPQAGPSELAEIKSLLTCNLNLSRMAVNNFFYFFLWVHSVELRKEISNLHTFLLKHYNLTESEFQPFLLQQNFRNNISPFFDYLDLESQNTPGIVLPPSTLKALADFIEALIGAIYLDSKKSYTLTRDFIFRLGIFPYDCTKTGYTIPRNIISTLRKMK